MAPSEQVLLKILEERQKALHLIRERVDKTCTATLGGMLIMAGWVLHRPAALCWAEAVFGVCAVAVVVLVLRGVYLRDLERGFRTQQQVLVTIEGQLGLFDGVYPEAWRQAGSVDGQGRFFGATYRLLYLGAALLSATVLLRLILN